MKSRFILAATLFTIWQGALPSLAAQPGLIESEFIFEHAPFPQCHASTLAETKAGLIAAWFGGTREKDPDVGIWSSRFVDGKWTTPVELANGIQYTEPNGKVHRHPCWNPVLSQSKDGPLLLFYKAGPSPGDWWGMLMTSDDSGKTWSQPRRLPEGIVGPVKNKPVQLANGDLLCPTSSENEGWRAHFEWTPDLGKTWFRTKAINDGKSISTIQPSVLIHPDGRLQAVGRSRQGKIWQAWSSDNGRTWSEVTLTELPNPNSGIDAVTLRDGRHLVIYNHTPKGRSPLNLAISTDGQSWKQIMTLETEKGEFSYPAIIQTADGLVHASYTWKRERIKHVVLDPTKLGLAE